MMTPSPGLLTRSPRALVGHETCIAFHVTLGSGGDGVHRTFELLLIAAVLIATPSASSADSKTPESKPEPIGGLSFVNELEVTVVNILAHVTDKGDNPVTDLTAEDFRIVQDGEVKPVTNFQLFTEEQFRQRATPDAAEILSPPEPVVEEAESVLEPRPVFIVLYVDHENLRPLDRNRVLRVAQEFVRDNLRPPVQMMVASYDKSLDIVQPFTDDPRAVIDALRAQREVTGGRPERESARHEVTELLQRYIEEEGTVSGQGARETREYQDIFGRIVAYANEEVSSLQFSIDALREVLGFISGMTGKKSILYVSNGLPMVPGTELFTTFANTFQDYSILNQLTRFDRSRLFEALTSSANAQDVTFYTIGAGGLEVASLSGAEYRSPTDASAAMLGSKSYLDSLRFMAERTGGIAVVNTNDFEAGLVTIQRDIHTYYSLGYTLTAGGADKIHRIEVTLPDHPDYKLRYRRQFVEKSMETRVQEKVVTGLMFELADNPMDVKLDTGAPAPATEDRWTVPIHLSFPLNTVALLPEGEDYVGRVTLFIAARDAKGGKSDLVRQEHEVRIPAGDYERARNERFGIDASLLMGAGSFRIAVGLMDQVTRQTSYCIARATVSQGS